MEDYSGGIIIIAMCGLVLLIGGLRKKNIIIINFILRGVMGILAIYGINMFLVWKETGLEIGINYLTIGITTLLGIPGILLLYGVNLFELFQRSM